MKEGKDKFCGMTQTFVSVATGARRIIVKNERNDSYWISTGGTDGIRVRSLPDDVCAQLQKPPSGFAADYHAERNGPPDIVRCPKAACYFKTEYGERRIMPG